MLRPKSPNCGLRPAHFSIRRAEHQGPRKFRDAGPLIHDASTRASAEPRRVPGNLSNARIAGEPTVAAVGRIKSFRVPVFQKSDVLTHSSVTTIPVDSARWLDSFRATRRNDFEALSRKCTTDLSMAHRDQALRVRSGTCTLPPRPPFLRTSGRCTGRAGGSLPPHGRSTPPAKAMSTIPTRRRRGRESGASK
jgi:hypothetical protein